MAKEVPKFGSNEVIQFTGLKELSPEEQLTVNQICTESYEKLRKKLNNVTSLSVHIKCHSKSGSKKKYSFHLRCIAPTGIIESDKSYDWDLARAVHMAFEGLNNQIQHKFKTEVTHKSRSGMPQKNRIRVLWRNLWG